MRYVRYFILGVIGLALLMITVANRQIVTVQLEPFGLGAPFPQPVDVPLFIVIFGSALAGLVAGFVMEWIRERKHRRTIHDQQRETSDLRKEVNRLAKKVSKTDKDAMSPVPALRS